MYVVEFMKSSVPQVKINSLFGTTLYMLYLYTLYMEKCHGVPWINLRNALTSCRTEMKCQKKNYWIKFAIAVFNTKWPNLEN